MNFLVLLCAISGVWGTALRAKVPKSWAVKDSGYPQLYSMRFTSQSAPAVVAWPALSFDPLEVISHGLGLFVVRSNTALHACHMPLQASNNTGIPPPPLDCRTVMNNIDSSYRIASNGTTLLAANQYEARWLDSHGGTRTQPLSLGGAVNAVAIGHRAWLATSRGVYWLDAAGAHIVTVPGLQPHCAARSVAVRAINVAVGLDCGPYGALVRFAGAPPVNFRHEFTPGVIDTVPRGLAFAPGGELWIADNTVHKQAANEISLKRFGPKQGLPRNGSNHIVVCESTGSVWVGSDRGLLRYGKTHGRMAWKALLGGRWLPGKLAGSPSSKSFFDGQRVLSMAQLPKGIKTGPNGKPLHEGIVVVTDGGLAVVTQEIFTMRDKADMLESRMRPRHLRFGLTDDARLKTWGDVYSWYGHPTDNDGLHTAGYILAEAYRFQSTNITDAQTRGLDCLDALRLLNNATGIKGYPARTVAKHLPVPRSGQWYPSKALPGFFFKGNTSSDEITGHLGAYPIAANLLGSPHLAKELHLNMIDYIMRNNYTLIGYNGQPTRWGNWNPRDANYDPSWEDERGLNSAELLGFLSAAYHLSGDSKYTNAITDLVTHHGSGVNLLNLKIDNPADYAFFDDHLGCMALRNLMYYWYGTNHASNIDRYIDGAIEQWYPRGKLAQLTPDIILYAVWCSVTKNQNINPTEDIKVATDVLKDWPLDSIAYPSYNDDRWDLVRDPEIPGRLMKPLPRDEHTAMMWAHGGFQINGGTGVQDSNPKDYLMAYWMAVYHGAIV